VHQGVKSEQIRHLYAFGRGSAAVRTIHHTHCTPYSLYTIGRIAQQYALELAPVAESLHTFHHRHNNAKGHHQLLSSMHAMHRAMQQSKAPAEGLSAGAVNPSERAVSPSGRRSAALTMPID
jgi:hypothetical protein